MALVILIERNQTPAPCDRIKGQFQVVFKLDPTVGNYVRIAQQDNPPCSMGKVHQHRALSILQMGHGRRGDRNRRLNIILIFGVLSFRRSSFMFLVRQSDRRSKPRRLHGLNLVCQQSGLDRMNRSYIFSHLFRFCRIDVGRRKVEHINCDGPIT